MPKFLNHDALAADLFNLNHTTGTGILASWKETLTNSEALLQLLVGRMEQDWLALAVKSRKPWNVKDCDSWVGVGLGPYRSNKLDNKSLNSYNSLLALSKNSGTAAKGLRSIPHLQRDFPKDGAPHLCTRSA